MKANRKFLNNSSGDVGVGTLIIFIAMVLVAAVAATVLIYTTGALQQKATKTSKEATQQIASNIIVEQVLGNRTDPTTGGSPKDKIQSLIVRVKPDVGTTSIDLRQVIVTIWDKENHYDLNYSDGSINLPKPVFTAESVRDEDVSFSKDTPVLNSGDLVALRINFTQIASDTTPVPDISLTTRKTFWLSLNQELGQAINLEITTPNSFGVNRYVQLYP